MSKAEDTSQPEGNTGNRRDFFMLGARGLFGLGVVGGLAALAKTGSEASEPETVWQIDPDKCTMCGNCATACVLKPSAVKCMHAYAICGYCELCGGYHNATAQEYDTAAETSSARLMP